MCVLCDGISIREFTNLNPLWQVCCRLCVNFMLSYDSCNTNLSWLSEIRPQSASNLWSQIQTRYNGFKSVNVWIEIGLTSRNPYIILVLCCELRQIRIIILHIVWMIIEIHTFPYSNKFDSIFSLLFYFLGLSYNFLHIFSNFYRSILYFQTYQTWLRSKNCFDYPTFLPKFVKS